MHRAAVQAMILRPGRVYSYYLFPTLKVCIHIVHELFDALEIFAPGARAPMPPPMAMIWLFAHDLHEPPF